MENIIGRPKLSQMIVDTYAQKLEPYLKRGLSVRKACYLAKVPHSTIYELIQRDEKFSDKVEAFKAYKSALVSDLFMFRLEELTEKVRTNIKLKALLHSKRISKASLQEIQEKLDGAALKQADWSFLQWVATNDRVLANEYGSKPDVIYDKSEQISQALNLLDREATETDYGQFAKDVANELKYYSN